jgi:hypothetical protein
MTATLTTPRPKVLLLCNSLNLKGFLVSSHHRAVQNRIRSAVLRSRSYQSTVRSWGLNSCRKDFNFTIIIDCWQLNENKLTQKPERCSVRVFFSKKLFEFNGLSATNTNKEKSKIWPNKNWTWVIFDWELNE